MPSLVVELIWSLCQQNLEPPVFINPGLSFELLLVWISWPSKTEPALHMPTDMSWKESSAESAALANERPHFLAIEAILGEKFVVGW